MAAAVVWAGVLLTKRLERTSTGLCCDDLVLNIWLR